MDKIDKTRLRTSVDILIRGHVGEDDYISNDNLTKEMRSNGFFAYEYDDLKREIRVQIRELRHEGKPICSKGGKGYFWPATYAEVVACAGKEFESKAKNMLVTAKILKDSAAKLFKISPQMELFDG